MQSTLMTDAKHAGGGPPGVKGGPGPSGTTDQVAASVPKLKLAPNIETLEVLRLCASYFFEIGNQELTLIARALFQDAKKNPDNALQHINYLANHLSETDADLKKQLKQKAANLSSLPVSSDTKSEPAPNAEAIIQTYVTEQEALLKTHGYVCVYLSNWETTPALLNRPFDKGPKNFNAAVFGKQAELATVIDMDLDQLGALTPSSIKVLYKKIDVILQDLVGSEHFFKEMQKTLKYNKSDKQHFCLAVIQGYLFHAFGKNQNALIRHIQKRDKLNAENAKNKATFIKQQIIDQVVRQYLAAITDPAMCRSQVIAAFAKKSPHCYFSDQAPYYAQLMDVIVDMSDIHLLKRNVSEGLKLVRYEKTPTQLAIDAPALWNHLYNHFVADIIPNIVSAYKKATRFRLGRSHASIMEDIQTCLEGITSDINKGVPVKRKLKGIGQQLEKFYVLQRNEKINHVNPGAEDAKKYMNLLSTNKTHHYRNILIYLLNRLEIAGLYQPSNAELSDTAFAGFMESLTHEYPLLGEPFHMLLTAKATFPPMSITAASSASSSANVASADSKEPIAAVADVKSPAPTPSSTLVATTAITSNTAAASTALQTVVPLPTEQMTTQLGALFTGTLKTDGKAAATIKLEHKHASHYEQKYVSWIKKSLNSLPAIYEKIGGTNYRLAIQKLIGTLCVHDALPDVMEVLSGIYARDVSEWGRRHNDPTISVVSYNANVLNRDSSNHHYHRMLADLIKHIGIDHEVRFANTQFASMFKDAAEFVIDDPAENDTNRKLYTPFAELFLSKPGPDAEPKKLVVSHHQHFTFNA